jgi:hypothetical protein
MRIEVELGEGECSVEQREVEAWYHALPAAERALLSTRTWFRLSFPHDFAVLPPGVRRARAEAVAFLDAVCAHPTRYGFGSALAAAAARLGPSPHRQAVPAPAHMRRLSLTPDALLGIAEGLSSRLRPVHHVYARNAGALVDLAYRGGSRDAFDIAALSWWWRAEIGRVPTLAASRIGRER